MRIGSLCSGIGGLELGLEQAGLGETVWQCEYDPHARTILERHWDVPIYNDVTDTDWTTVEPVDVICAGYPCQPFSQAGQRQGTDDDRHLWPAVRDAISSLGPRLVVLENVRGHLSLGFPEVLGDLADLGLDAEWCLLRASDVGAPHQRARLFVVAYPAGVGLEGTEPFGQRVELESVDLDGRGRRLPAPDPDESGSQGRGVLRERGRERPTRPSGLATAPDPGGVRRNGGPSIEGSGGKQTERSETGDHVGDSPTSWGPYAAAVARWERHTRPAPAPTDGGRLNPQFVEWMMGFDEGWVACLTRAQALRCLGNAVVPQVAERFGRMIAAPVPA